ncbi:MAG: shikimate kinase [Gammaproteobacteria bacterium]|nr:MAG: shikimate kinase [Gammaproteobacteria bacterium]
MNQFSTSVILIGMPGSGKSTLGIQLAKMLAKDFIDTDLLIQTKHGQTLQDIINNQGYLALRDIEEQVLLDTHYPNHIIATGGSAVYSEKAMQHLHHYGQIIFLDVALSELKSRVSNIDTRGLARRPGQTFEELYEERQKLYERYANITINCTGKSQKEILDLIIYEDTEVYMDKDA